MAPGFQAKTEARTMAPGFEAKTEAKTMAPRFQAKTEAKTMAPGFQAKTEAEAGSCLRDRGSRPRPRHQGSRPRPRQAVASETEAVDPETKAKAARKLIGIGYSIRINIKYW